MTKPNETIKQSIEKHQVSYDILHDENDNDVDLLAVCSCGASWTIALDKSEEYINSIEEAHRTYGQKIRPDIST